MRKLAFGPGQDRRGGLWVGIEWLRLSAQLSLHLENWPVTCYVHTHADASWAHPYPRDLSHFHINIQPAPHTLHAFGGQEGQEAKVHIHEYTYSAWKSYSPREEFLRT